jgi:aminoglycoside phosphotransferase (APT) family kinase protein
MSNPCLATRARYYDALLEALDSDVKAELQSERAKFLYGAMRRILSRLSTANEQAALLPENLSAVHPDGWGATPAAADAADFERAVRHEGQLLDAIETRVSTRLTGTRAATECASPAPVSAAALEAFLHARVDPDLRLVKFRILAGGRSKQTIMLTLADAEGRQVERVIRRDLLIVLTGATVVDEYRVLGALAERGYPVPRPLLLEESGCVLGSPFMLMEKVNGAVAGDIFDPPAGRKAVLRSAEVLGRLHAMPVAAIAPTLREHLRAAPGAAALRDQVLELQQVWAANARAHCVTMDAVFRWLLANVEAVTPRASVVHGDYSYHNLLFDGDELTAVMDWELVRIGHPAEDLGYIRAAAVQRVAWPEFLAAYESGGGRYVSPRDVTFHTLMGKLRLMRLLFGARQYFESGATNDLQLADVSLFHLPRMVQQCSVEIRLALGLSA